MTAPIDTVRQQLEAKGCDPRQRGDKLTAKCPAHEDRSPSLSVTEADDGKVLVYCFAGCSHADIVQALDLKTTDLFPPSEGRKGEECRLVATYTYELADGTPTLQVQRYEPKDFRQKHWDGRRWAWGAGDVPRVPYRLPHITRAIEQGATIWVVEGEKDVHAIEATDPDIVATCCAGGAGRWTEAEAATLRGAKVVGVIADRDRPGRAHAKAVATSLIGHVGEVQVWEPLTGKDAADHLSAGQTMDDLELVWIDGDAPGTLYGDIDDYQDHAAPTTKITRIITTAELLSLKPPPMLIDGWLSVESTGLLQGPSGVGKSFVAIDMALSVASGERWVKTYDVVAPGHVVYIIGEGAHGIPSRLGAWAEDRKVEVRDLPIWWVREPVSLFDPGAVGTFLGELADAGVEPKLMIFDTLARCSIGADENSASDMGIVMEQITHLARSTGSTVLALHHTGKDESRGARGSSAIKGAIDTAIQITGDSLRMEMKAEKQRDMAHGPTTIMRLEELAWSAVAAVYDDGRHGDGQAELTKKERAAWATYLKAGRPMTRAEWVAKCDGEVARTMVYEAIRKLIESGQIIDEHDVLRLPAHGE